MTETKIYCDHCGKELDHMKDYIDLDIEMNHKCKTTDLCVECFDKLWSMIDDFCSNVKHMRDIDIDLIVN